MAEKKRGLPHLNIFVIFALVALIVLVIGAAGVVYFVQQGNYERKIADLNSKFNSLTEEQNSLVSRNTAYQSQVKNLNQELEASNAKASKDYAIFTEMKNFELYKAGYADDYSSISASFLFLNATADYSSCMAYVGKMEEQHNLFYSDEQKTEAYFEKFADYVNKTTCYEKLADYKNKRNVANDMRKAYREVDANWCYGVHRAWNPYGDAAWYLGWKEQYGTPSVVATGNMSKAEKNLSESFNNFIKTCFA